MAAILLWGKLATPVFLGGRRPRGDSASVSVDTWVAPELAVKTCRPTDRRTGGQDA